MNIRSHLAPSDWETGKRAESVTLPSVASLRRLWILKLGFRPTFEGVDAFRTTNEPDPQ